MNGRLEHDLKIQKANQKKLESMPEIVKEYYDFMKASRMTEATCRNYLSKIHHFLTFLKLDNDTFKGDNIKANDVTRYLNSLEIKKDKDGNETYTSDSYKQTVWICLNGFMGFLVSNGYLKRNYMSDIAKPKIKDEDRVNEKRIKLSSADFRSILWEIDKNNDMVARKRDKAMMSLMMTTGMRESALSEINVDNVNLDEHKIVGIAKGKKAMEYTFNSNTAKAIKEWITVRDGYQRKEKSESLFLSNQGNRIAVNSIAKMVKKYTKKALGKELSPHKIRAGYCTILYEQTNDIEFVRRAVGHANSKTTQRYCVSRGTERAEAAEMIGI